GAARRGSSGAVHSTSSWYAWFHRRCPSGTGCVWRRRRHWRCIGPSSPSALSSTRVRRVGRVRRARPQWTTGPGQTEGNRSRQAEFVICEQSIERGFSFLKDPLFLASSVFVKKPTRIVALSLVMVLGLLVYRLAEHRLREQLAATGQTVPNQLKQPTD